MDKQQVFFILEKYIKSELVNITSFLEHDTSNSNETTAIKQEIEEVFSDEYFTLECNENRKLFYSLYLNLPIENKVRDNSSLKPNNITCEIWEFQTVSLESLPNTM